jgi:hypothetical protein
MDLFLLVLMREHSAKSGWPPSSGGGQSLFLGRIFSRKDLGPIWIEGVNIYLKVNVLLLPSASNTSGGGQSLFLGRIFFHPPQIIFSP